MTERAVSAAARSGNWEAPLPGSVA